MTVRPQTPIVKLFDLYEGSPETGPEHSFTRDFTGRTLDEELAILKAGTLADWDVTFDEDFDDITTAVVANSAVTVTPSTGHGPFMARGMQTLQQGVFEHPNIEDTDYPDMFFQAAPSVLGMKARRWSGTASGGSPKRAKSASMSLGRFATAGGGVDCKLEPVISFAQQYGFFEARIKSPNPHSPAEFNGVLWPAAPWFYSLNQFGGTPGNVHTSRGEIDPNENYPDSRGGELASVHCTMHKHESRSGLLQPYEWGRNLSDSSNIISMTNPSNWPIFGTDVNYRLYNQFYDIGMLMTPEWCIMYFNRIEMGRFEMHHEQQQKWVPLITLGVQVNDVPAGQTTPFDTDWVLEVDYFKVWQNPDWHRSDLSPITNEPKAMGGTANAKTFTTDLTFASYSAADGFIFVAKANSNNTGATTMNVNTKGALSVVKEGPETNLPLTPYVRSTSFGQLVADDIVSGEYYAYKIDNANSRIIQLDKGRTMKHQVQWAEPAFTEPLVDLDVYALEARVAHRFHLGDLFPSDLPRPTPDLFPDRFYPHPARAEPFDLSLIPARMPPDVFITTVENKAVGSIIGRLDADNSPPRVRRTIESNTYFDINPNNGDVLIKAPPPQGLFTLTAHGWSVPPAPNVKGGNRTRLQIDVVEDVLFDLSFFGANRLAEFDATAVSSLTLVGSKVSQWDSLGSGVNPATQATDANRPVYDATGLNGRPCLTSAGSPILMNLASRLGLSGGTINFQIGLSESVFQDDTTSATGDAYNYTIPHILYWEWNPVDGAKCFVNGVDIGVVSVSGPDFINNGWAIAVLSAQIPTGRGIMLAQNNTVADLFASRTTSNTSFKGKLGWLAFAKGAQTTEGRDKLHGYAGWKFWNAADVLPSDHPYKSAAPRMIG